MPFSKIKQTKSLKQIAFEVIKDAIINHEILPGEPLYERYVREKLEISRTPIREAIQLLELEGWVTSVPRKGTFVSNISVEGVEEILQSRRALEVLTIELLIPKITDEQLIQLERILSKQEETKDDKKTFIAIDKEFHQHLATFSGNRRIAQLIETYGDQIRWFGYRAITQSGRVEETLKEHRAIFEGLKARDLGRAKQAVLDHMEQTRLAIISGIQQG